MCPCWITIQTTNDWAGVRYERGFVGFGVESGGRGRGKCLQHPSSEGPVRNSADNGNFFNYSLSVNNFLFCRGGYQIDSYLSTYLVSKESAIQLPVAASCQPLSAALVDEFGRVSVVRR